MPTKRTTWVVYHLTYATTTSTKVYLSRIGVGTDNPDGSIDIELESTPIDGKLHLRKCIEIAAEGIQHKTTEKREIDHFPKTPAELDGLMRAGIDPKRIRTPEGTINNCALANGDYETNCQVCKGNCPDREKLLNKE